MQTKPRPQQRPKPPHNTRVSKRVVKHLENLFELVPPEELKGHLLKIFMLFLINEHNTLPVNFEKIVTHYHALFHFLDIATEERATPQHTSNY